VSFEVFHIIREKVTGELYLECKQFLTQQKVARFELVSEEINGWSLAYTTLQEMKKNNATFTGPIVDIYLRQLERKPGDPKGIKPVIGQTYQRVMHWNNNGKVEFDNFIVVAEVFDEIYSCREFGRYGREFEISLDSFQKYAITADRSMDWVDRWERENRVPYPIARRSLVG